MCLGPEVAALAALGSTAGAAYSNYRANKATVEEQNRLQQAERLRQQQLQQESQAKLAEAMQTFTPEARAATVQQNAEARTASMAPQAAPQPQYQPATSSAPNVVKADADRRARSARTASGVRAGQRALLEAMGDASLGESFRLSRAGQDMARLQGFSNRSLGVHREQMSQAGGKGDRWRRNAQIAGTLGKIGNAFASMGAGGGGMDYGTIDPTQAGSGLPY